MQKPAKLLTYGQLRDGLHQQPFYEPSVELESNRPIEPIKDNQWYWEQALVRRGHPLRQLSVMASIVTIQATLTHITALVSPVALGVYGILWIVITVACALGIMDNVRLVRHGLLMYALLFAGAIIGLI